MISKDCEETSFLLTINDYTQNSEDIPFDLILASGKNAKIEKNFVYLYLGPDIEKNHLRELSYKIIENINKSAVLEGKSPNTIAGLSLILSYKLLNDNSDDFKDFFSTFSTKNTLIKYFEEIYNQLEPTGFMAKFYDVDGNELNVTPHWSISDFENDLDIEEDDNYIYISVDNKKLINKKFILSLSADNYETVTKTITIRAFV